MGEIKGPIHGVLDGVFHGPNNIELVHAIEERFALEWYSASEVGVGHLELVFDGWVFPAGDV